MILDILTLPFFVLGFAFLFWMIGERRRDVLHGPFVTKEQHMEAEVTKKVWDDPQLDARSSNGIGSSKRRFQPRSATGLDRLAQPLHRDFDILRLQMAPALELGLVPLVREALEIIPLSPSWRPIAPW
jgi:hypothetical protein